MNRKRGRGRPRLEAGRVELVSSFYRHPGPTLHLEAKETDALRELLLRGFARGAKGLPNEYLEQMVNSLLGFLTRADVNLTGIVDISSENKGELKFSPKDIKAVKDGFARDLEYYIDNHRLPQLKILRHIQDYVTALIVENNVVPDKSEKLWYRVGHGRYVAPNIQLARHVLRHVDRLYLAAVAATKEKSEGELYCAAGCGRRVPAGVAFCPATAVRPGGAAQAGTCYETFQKQLQRWRKVAAGRRKRRDSTLLA